MTTVRAVVAGDIALFDLPPKSLERLRLALRLPNQKYRQAMRMKFKTDEPEWIEVMQEYPDGSTRVPRGAWELVKATCARDGVTAFRIDDRRTPGLPIGGPVQQWREGLRDYQEEGVRKLLERLQGLVVLPPGTGKSRLGAAAVAAIMRTTLVLAPTIDLVDQWKTELTRMFDTFTDIMTLKQEWHRLVPGDVTIMTYAGALQMLKNDPDIARAFGFVIVDECFPAGTMVGGHPIEQIQIGDFIPSYDEKSGSFTTGRVVDVFVSRPKSMVRLFLSDGQTVACTPGHPFLTANGWIPAATLLNQHLIGKYDGNLRLRPMSDADEAEAFCGQTTQLLFACLQISMEEDSRARETPFMRTVRCRYRHEQSLIQLQKEKWSRVLLRPMPEHSACFALSRVLVVGHRSRDGQKNCSGFFFQDEAAQSDVHSERERTHGSDPSFNWGLEAYCPRRERPRPNCSGTDSCIGPELAHERNCQDRAPSSAWNTNLLQDRCGQRRPDDCHRSRRTQPHRAESQSSGSQERKSTSVVRVDRVEVLEQSGDGTFGGMCPDGLVYNLHIEGTETYLANGLIVHNCHSAAAPSIQTILRALPARWRLGLTATPEREDGLEKLVDWSFGPRLLERTTTEMIHLKYLMPAEVEEVATGFTYVHAGPDRTKNTMMESALVEDPARNALIAEHAALAAQDGETVLVLTGRKSHAKALAEMIGKQMLALAMPSSVSACGELKPSALHVTSKTNRRARKSVIGDFREGSLRVLVATSLADEGLDIPRLSRVLLAFPYRARCRTQQRLGRLLRKFAGKKPMLVDFVDGHVPTLASRASARRSVYRAAGLIR